MKEESKICQVRFTVINISSFLENIKKIGEKYESMIVCFNQEVIAGQRHVKSAIMHAMRSFNSGNNIARRLEVEALLYAAGTRQTGLIGPFGIHCGINECYLCIISNSKNQICDFENILIELEPIVGKVVQENWEVINLEKEERLKKIFDITQKEIAICGKERIIDLVRERVALLTVNH